MKRKLWSKEELILAFNLYLKTPFGKMHSTNKDVIYLAHLIGRTPNSVALRLVNFASVDPVLKARGIKGMDGGKKIVQPIWDEFFNNQEELIFLSEKILAEKENFTVEQKFEELFLDSKPFVKRIGFKGASFIVTHAPAKVRYLGKLDNKSQKKQRAFRLEREKPTEEQLSFLAEEAGDPSAAVPDWLVRWKNDIIDSRLRGIYCRLHCRTLLQY